MKSAIESEVVILVRFKPRSVSKDLISAEILHLVRLIRRQLGCVHFDVYRAANSADWFLHQVWTNGESYERYQHSHDAAQLRVILRQRSASASQEWQLSSVFP